ncbi:MAG: ferrous iron transport protein A [Caldisericia bacterium]|nr:ferrous iron transport protein A [Caldisericia bacterium]
MRHSKRTHCRCRGHKRCLSLSDAPCKKNMRVCSVDGNENYVRRLFCMGIIKGQDISVIRKSGEKEAVIIESNGSKFAIDYNLCENIEVEEETADNDSEK